MLRGRSLQSLYKKRSPSPCRIHSSRSFLVRAASLLASTEEPHSSLTIPGCGMFLVITLFFVASLSSRSLATCSGTQNFLITARFDWSQETDASFPIDVQSPGFRLFTCVTHDSNYLFWAVDKPIAKYLKDYIISYREGTEDGIVIGNLTEKYEAEKRSSKIADYARSEQDTLEPTESFNLTITADGTYSKTLLSCFSLIRPSDDWFVGISNINLCDRRTLDNGSEWGTDPEIFRIFSFDAGIYESSTYVSTGELDPQDPPDLVRRLRVVAAEGYGTLNVTASRSDSSTNNQTGQNIPACFPSGELVTLSTGTQIPIENIEVGQQVRILQKDHSYSSVSSSVFLFSHRDPTALSAFLNITFVSSEKIIRHLRISRGHYIYAYRKGDNRVSSSTSSKTRELVPAIRIRPGDYLVGVAGDKMLVTTVEEVLARGLYNPHTIHGDLIVSNVRVSSYTTAVKPTTASILLAPLRFFHRLRMYYVSHKLAAIIARVANSNPLVMVATQP